MLRPGVRPGPLPFRVPTGLTAGTFPVTPAMLGALAQAIAGGVSQVSYGDRSITFFDLDDLLRAWDWVAGQLGLLTPATPVRRSTCFSKGLSGGSHIGGGVEHQEVADALFSRQVAPDPTRTTDVDWERGR
jgi:hypothetical protein